MRGVLLLILFGAVGAVRVSQLRGPAPSDAETAIDAASVRAEKEVVCAEKKCVADQMFWCEKACMENEDDCSADARSKRLAELSSRTECAGLGKAWCYGKCNAKAACAAVSNVDCDNLDAAAPAATGATGGATGAAAAVKTTTVKPAAATTPKPATTAAAPATTAPAVTSPDVEEVAPKKDMSGCDMVRPWETNKWYIEHVLPGPPPTTPVCNLALLKELLARIALLEAQLKNCKSKEECDKIRAMLAGLKTALKAAEEGADMNDEKSGKHNQGVNGHDSEMTKAWDGTALYKEHVAAPIKSEKFTEFAKPSQDEEVRVPRFYYNPFLQPVPTTRR